MKTLETETDTITRTAALQNNIEVLYKELFHS